jgi:hypothetical protein
VSALHGHIENVLMRRARKHAGIVVGARHRGETAPERRRVRRGRRDGSRRARELRPRGRPQRLDIVLDIVQELTR